MGLHYEAVDYNDPLTLLLAAEDELPSGDELGAEFERFLAEQAGNGPDGNGDTSSTN